MRRFFVAGNWKMNTTRSEAESLAGAVAEGLGRFDDLDVAVFPPFTYLQAVGAVLQDSAVALGAQDLYYEPDGAFTGEVSGAMLADVGCRYVLIGHSERRHVLGETDSNVHSKLRAALEADLYPVVCVGERLEEREQDRTEAVVRRQLTTALEGVSADELRRVTIAYEPVWAIGTGKTATPDQAQAVHLYLRNLVSDRYNHVAAGQLRILYGGSVKPENALSLLEQADLDGALVGGASLSADAFLAIVAAARSAARS